MQVPKSRRRQKLREKKCQYPGCEKIFFGIHISKYCPEHRQDRYRIRKRSRPEDVNIKNQTLKHNNTEVVEQVMECALEGCTNQFEVKIYPRQYIYPKYCPEHRNEYKRIRHLQLIGREDLIELMKMEGESLEIDSEMDSCENENENENENNEDIIEGVA
ncbi:MAG: hypothetical protein Q4F84_03065 [Fibrobacter sp.]|nr:hypothetical protein [Fibrobacter sp.]